MVALLIVGILFVPNLYRYDKFNKMSETKLKEAAKMKVKFFSAECRLCEGTLNILTNNFPKIKIDVHRASECKDGICCVLAERYGVRAVSSLVVDGEVVLVGLPDEQDLLSLAEILHH